MQTTIQSRRDISDEYYYYESWLYFFFVVDRGPHKTPVTIIYCYQYCYYRFPIIAIFLYVCYPIWFYFLYDFSTIIVTVFIIVIVARKRISNNILLLWLTVLQHCNTYAELASRSRTGETAPRGSQRVSHVFRGWYAITPAEVFRVNAPTRTEQTFLYTSLRCRRRLTESSW